MTPALPGGTLLNVVRGCRLRAGDESIHFDLPVMASPLLALLGPWCTCRTPAGPVPDCLKRVPGHRCSLVLTVLAPRCWPCLRHLYVLRCVTMSISHWIFGGQRQAFSMELLSVPRKGTP